LAAYAAKEFFETTNDYFCRNNVYQEINVMTSMHTRTYSRYLLLPLLTVLLAFGCRQDQGERLFLLSYLPQEFVIPAGYSPFQTLVFSYENLPTNYQLFLSQSIVSDADVLAIVPNFATITSLDNLDFGFLNAVSVRVCPVGSERCTEADEVFFLTDLYRRRLDRLNLNPGLRNVRTLMSGVRYKMEVVFFPGETTPYNVTCRFDYGFEARR
jgi:hypothetical protein